MVSQSALEKVAPFTDLVFLDIKTLDPEKSVRHTGMLVQKLQEIIQLLNQLQEIHPKLEIEIRTPLIPGITDDTENLMAIGLFIEQWLKQVKNWELCMFNDFCDDKYMRMGLNWILDDKKHHPVDYWRFTAIQNKFEDLNIIVTGFISTTI